MWLATQAVSRLKCGGDQCQAFRAHLQGLQFPQALSGRGRQLHRLFEPKMVAKQNVKNTVIGNASHQYTLHPIVREWMLASMDGCPALREHAAVYEAAYEVVRALTLVKHRRLTTVEAKPRLLAAVGRWQSLHQARYGTRYWKPKFFWLWSIARRVDAAEWLFDMFVVERMHQKVRPQAELVKNARRWEFGVLSKVLDAQVCSLVGKEALEYEARVEERARGNAFAIAPIGAIHVNDIVVDRGGRKGAVVSCEIFAGVPSVRVEVMLFAGQGAWRHTAMEEVWPAGGVHLAIAWYKRRGGCFAVVDV
jgi:hypothetical protein